MKVVLLNKTAGVKIPMKFMILTSSSCTHCKSVKEYLTKQNLEYSEYDVSRFMTADYGLPKSNDDFRLELMLGLVKQNNQLPVVLQDGKLVDFSFCYSNTCIDGVCTLGGHK